MSRFFTFLFILCLFTPEAHAKMCDRVGLYAEALFMSEHLSDDYALPGGYNESNTGVSAGAVCKKHFTNFDVNGQVGGIIFENSYYDTSMGVALGLNLSTPIYDRWDVFGGTNIAIVNGYEDLSDNVRIGDETAILPAIAGGVSYNFTDNVSFRATANVIPSIGSSDGVFLPTLGIQYLY